MNIHDSQRPLGPARDAQIDLTRPNREAIAKAIEGMPERREAAREPAADAAGTRTDRLELSAASKMLIERAATGEATESEKHAAKLAELKARYLDGTLNSPERVERAATKLLSGD